MILFICSFFFWPENFRFISKHKVNAHNMHIHLGTQPHTHTPTNTPLFTSFVTKFISQCLFTLLYFKISSISSQDVQIIAFYFLVWYIISTTLECKSTIDRPQWKSYLSRLYWFDLIWPTNCWCSQWFRNKKIISLLAKIILLSNLRT